MAEEVSTRELILRLALEDVDERKERVIGKLKPGSILNDEQIALENHASELQIALQLLIDAHFAQSLHNAMNADGDLLMEFAARERMEELDRGIAIGLSRPGSVIPSRLGTPQRSGAASPLRPDPRRPNASVSKRINENCAICMEIVGMQRSLRAPCGHYYDAKCLLDLVRNASMDESSFPPRCCRTEIPKDSLTPFLSREVLTAFEKAWKEYSTKPKDRVYCSNPVCSQFIAAATRTGASRSIHCRHCGQYTCSSCRRIEHSGRFCEPQEDMKLVEALLKDYKWQRCPECSRVIELTLGCFHITCFCRAEWCYKCAVPWKECKCPQWEEQLLLEEARRRVNTAIEIEAEGRPYAPPAATSTYQAARARDVRVQQMVGRLRTNHVCVHDWHKRNGGGNCGNCGQYLKLYLLSCRDCYMAVCVRCARNRL